MKRAFPAARLTSARVILNHLGHELVWLAIAVLFCLVEAAVRLTELNPLRLVRARIAVRTAPPLSTKPASLQV